MIRRYWYFLTSICLALLTLPLIASEPLKPFRTPVAPVIDGVLDDLVWQSAPMVTGFKTFTPDWGKDQAERTEVRMAYDDSHLYFAYHCFDREPEKIKASVSNRDNMFRDDWICINLDSFGDQQSLYGFYVNPLGIQGDTRATTTNEDMNFDAVWESAGRITSDGFIVEVAIPVKSIRFAEGESVEMGVIFERRISRRSEQGTFPALDPAKGNSWLTQMHPMIYEGIKPYTLVEILPAITFVNRERATGGKLTREEQRGEFGITAKYGITQDLILDATYNPDFSQVEADAGQVDVNLRYQLFYAEKRPFFLEGNEQFMITGTPDLLYTRTIANPIVGAKLTGKLSTTQSIAALYAADELSDEEQTEKGRYGHVGMARYQYSLGEDSFIGAVLASRELKQRGNRIAGIDGMIRVTPASTLSLQGLLSSTDDPLNPSIDRGHKYEIGYSYVDRDLSYGAIIGRISEDFTADMGYIPRTGFEYYEAFVTPKYYPTSELFRRIVVAAGMIRNRDLYSGLWEMNNDLSSQVLLGGTFNAALTLSNRTEVFLNRTFNTNFYRFVVESQFTKEFMLGAAVAYQNSIYYSDDPFAGHTRQATMNIRYQPMQNINAEYSLTFSDFARASDDQRLYSYTISRGKLTYQISRFLFVRGVMEYNNFRKRLLTDALVSFTYIPGTVVYGGYGSVHEKLRWEADSYVQSTGFLQTRQGFFFKASYLWRL